MILQFLFLALAISSLFCIMMDVRMKRHNIGFIMMNAFVIICDIICFRLFGCKNVDDANNLLSFYFIFSQWVVFAMLSMIFLFGKRKKSILFCIPTTLICILQTVIMVYNLTNNGIFNVYKRIILHIGWWITENIKNKPNIHGILTYNTYNVLCIVNILVVLLITYISCVRSGKIFRIRFYAMIGFQLLLLVIEILTIVFSLPICFTVIYLNFVCLISLYFSCYYSGRKLRDWSLTKFANEMSDGFLLYNEYGDLIQVNDLLKYVFPYGQINSFESREYFDEWITENTISIDDNLDVVKYDFDGKDTYYKVRKTELTDADSAIGTIYILHDTTDSVQRMYTMEQANLELERAAKMKTDFLANMSHEIRTPMNAVIGMAEIALRENLPDNVKEYLLQIQNSGRNLVNIINDILDFSKIESGKMEIITEKYEPLSEINDIANLLATRIGDKNLELFVICDKNLPHVLEGDIMRIRQILINLANNAVKFTKEGMVLIKITVESLSANMINMIFHVIDTGQGIKNEDLPKLFNSFQQVDARRNRSVEGTGLGLAISQRLCEAMNGRIGVSSEYGKGSDFYFSLPQKVIDPSLDIVVEECEKKHATVLNENPEMLGMFIEEVNKLGVDGRVISNLSEFLPSGEEDFLFFEEGRYNKEIQDFLDDNKNIIGVILVDYDSTYVSDRDNLRVMRRPETTLGMVMTLNGREFKHNNSESNTAFKIDFTAPEAKILIVDDNAINITIAEGLLKPIKAQCVGVLSGREAVNKLKSETFDIIFMDHMMPEMDGVETTKLIRSTIPEAASTPIIALTANAMEGVKEMFINNGMNDFVAKPVDVHKLVSKLKQWLPEDKIINGESTHIIFQEDMTDFAGLEYEKALQALGSSDLYRTIVNEYYRSGYDRYNEIKNAYDNEDWKDYTIKVHALKSSSRQIGAFELGDMAEKLENAGKDLDMETITANTMSTLDKFNELLESLSKNFGAQEVDDRMLMDLSEDVMANILNELLEACDNLDMDSMENCKNELKKYKHDEKRQALLDEMYDAIDNIDVDTCIELVEEIRNSNYN